MRPLPLRPWKDREQSPVPILKVKNVFKCRLRVNKLTFPYEAIVFEAMWLYRKDRGKSPVPTLKVKNVF